MKHVFTNSLVLMQLLNINNAIAQTTS